MDNLKLNTKIKELFDTEFFIKFGNFIFDGDFKSFKEDCFKRKEQFSDNIKIIEFINPNYSSLQITDFDDFLVCFNTSKVFQYQVEMDILQIKYLLINYFNNREISDEIFSIKLSDKIIKDFYKSETDKLLNVELQNLNNDYYDNNDFIKFKDVTDINDYKAKIILFILNYTLNYAKEILINLKSDIQNLIDVYRLDTRYKLNCEIWDADSQLSKELNEKRKQLKCAKYNKGMGRKLKEHGTINPINVDELKQHIEIAKGIISQHKAEIKKICKLGKYKAQTAFDTYIKDLDYETQILLNIYFEENYVCKSNATVDFCAYKAMNYKFALDFFNQDNSCDTNSYEAMKKFVRRYEKNDSPKFKNLYSSDFEQILESLTIQAFDVDLAVHICSQILGQN